MLSVAESTAGHDFKLFGPFLEIHLAEGVMNQGFVSNKGLL